ncbi:hypothetical protein [Shimazuella kribbensis]|uniref:hypothetical protein n=1 Tax=Shimazuella kribbensis TaxID=139808 RepID=UPI00040619A6|nr:hypothetical protein [Shimazuella kribbensis]
MLTIFLSCWLAFFPVSDINEIQSMFYTKQQSVNKNDVSRFLSTLYPDEHYKQEQKRWFLDAVSFIDPKSFQMKVKSYQMISSNYYQVVITQTYRKKNIPYTFTYRTEVRKTKQGWKDADSLGYTRKKGAITVKYSDPILLLQAERAISILLHVSEMLGDKYVQRPKVIEAKLYYNPEVFRQSVKLSLPTWAGGWNEARQSIKLVIGKSDLSSLTHGLAHEYTHQLISYLTNDNAAYWLQEGAAMYYEALISKETPHIDRDFQPYTISQLERLNLEELSDEKASDYYVSCYIQFKKLIHQYGEQKLGNVFRHLHRYPYIDVDSAIKQKQTNQRTFHILQENNILPNQLHSISDAYLKKTNKNIL